MAACVAVAVLAAATAHAAEYKMVNCASNSGAPPYTIASNTGIFTFENDCVGQGGDPPGDKSFLRISEHEAGGMAAYGAYLSFNFETPTGDQLPLRRRLPARAQRLQRWLAGAL